MTAALLLILAAQYLAVRHRAIASRRLIADIESAGGNVIVFESPRPPLSWDVSSWSALVRWLKRYGNDGGQLTLTGTAFDSNWLKERGFLSDVSISTLQVQETRLTGSDLARIINCHEIWHLHVPHLEFNDEFINALSTSAELRVLDAGGGTLSDETLARLPLEQLRALDLAASRVTADGLEPLQRCAELTSISLDGSQLTEQSAQVLGSIPQLLYVALQGAGIEDGHLERLHSLNRLAIIELESTAATPGGIAALRSALPNCQVLIHH